MALSRAFLLAMAAVLLALPLISAQNVTALRGNITEVNITLFNVTPNWQGIAGQVFFGTNASAPGILNATGGKVNASNLFFQIDCDNPTSATGFIFLKNSSTPPSGLVAGNLSVLNSVVGNGADNATNTFTTTSSFALSTGTVTGVPTFFSYVNQTAQSSSFREGYFTQGNDIVFATVIEVDLTGYNTSFFDYQIIVAAPNFTTRPYYVFGDITFTCPGEVVGGGGGGWKGQWPNIIIRRPPKPRPTEPLREERLEEIEPDIEEILRKIELRIDPAESLVLNERLVHGVIINRNDWEIGEVCVDAQLPQMLIAPADAHPHPMLFWQSALPGIKSRGPRGEQVFDWAVSDLPCFPAIAPQSVTEFTFKVTPPLMLPKQVDLVAHATSGQARIASDVAPFEVLVPEFAVYSERINDRVLALYHLVDNRGKPGKRINIEFALNRRRSSLVAELLGPLDVPADSVAIFSHEYALSPRAQQADEVRTRLYAPDRTAAANAALR